MAIVRCPRCRDEVTVPAMATSRALVRCPLCLEQYLLAEAIANAPPPLVIIGGEVVQAAIDDSPVVGHDYRIAAAAIESADNHWGHAVAATMPPMQSVRSGRRRSREPNKVILFFSWIGGGVLGLPLAVLVLWWIFRTDPVELGPTVSAYAPWIVPAQFRGEPVISDRESEAAKQAAPRKPVADDAAKPVAVESDKPAAEVEPSAVEPHTARKPEASEPPVVKTEEPGPEFAPRPPMPDLTDLLP